MAQTENAPYYVYILRCADGSLYAGTTNDPAKRLATHNAGKGAKYTRGRLPVCLVYCEACPDKPTALRREIALKRLPRARKLALIATQQNAPGLDPGP